MTTNQKAKSSRLADFRKHSLPERVGIVAQWAGLESAEQAVLLGGMGLQPTQGDQMIENVIGTYALPMGIATNFVVNGKDYLIPMVIEEPSVVAGCSYAAKLVREGGGFSATSDEPIMIGQIQVLGLDNIYAAAGRLWEVRQRLIDEANEGSSIVPFGGGVRDIEFRPFTESPVGPMLIIHLLCDVRDAMGANTVNTACEKLAPLVEEITGGYVKLRILSNLADKRRAIAECRVKAGDLKTPTAEGKDVVRSIVEASAFAEVDPYRAATHNKGVMNGMDALCMATGNDWRALEAGVHAYAARSGRYSSVTRWTQDDHGDLRGRIEVPVAIGTIGGATRVHPTAKVALKILNVGGAKELAEVMAAVGLAQNLAAIRALATEGIQRGHMRLHARQMAIAAGASPEMVERVVNMMADEGHITLERAAEIVKELRAKG